MKWTRNRAWPFTEARIGGRVGYAYLAGFPSMKAVDPKLLLEIRSRLASEVGPSRVYLFGSHAWGTPGSDSDVDLLLVMPRLDGPRAEVLKRAYRAVRDLRVPAEFVVRTEDEMTRQATVPASLAWKVSQRGILLHG